jgi:hypothetical protein
MVLTSAVESTFLLAAENAQDRIPILVRSAQTAFSSPKDEVGRQDSVKDLLKKLKHSKLVRAVESEKEALLVLEVLGRETGSDLRPEEISWLWRWSCCARRSYLTARLIAGECSAEFTGESGKVGKFTDYGDAAKRVVKQVEAWVNANRDKVLAPKPPAGVAGTETTPQDAKPSACQGVIK